MDRELKRQLLRACKIDEPVPPSDLRHYDFDRSPELLRGQPWRERLTQVIDLAGEPVNQIVTGLPGSGKTTELRQLEADLTARGYTVVFADAGSWIRDDRPIETEDILLSLVLSLYPDGTPDGLKGWAREYAARAWKLLNTEAHVTEIGADISGANLKLELTSRDTLFQEVSARLRRAQGLRTSVFGLLETAAAGARRAGGRLVLILDGIEKRATGDLSGPEKREEHRNHWFGAFLVHARDLRPPIDVIYTVPPFMVRRAAELGNQFGHELLFLPMVRVLEWDGTIGADVSVHDPGVRAMTEALHLRVPPEHFESLAVPAWLAIHSGGYMRDMLRLAIESIYRCPEGGVITRQLADEAIIQVRQTYLEGIDSSDEALLTAVHRGRDFPRTESNQQRMDSLLQGYLMLRYHNSRFWYDAHPLLWDRLGIEGPSWDRIAAVCS